MKYEFLPHTADIKFKAYGENLQETFENVILAFSEFVAKGEKIKPKKGKIINVSGDDKENLLYNFLEELIYLMDAENFVVAKGDVFFRGNNLRAELFGDDAKNYKELDYAKAATYAEIEVKEEKGKCVVQAVIDV
jgi:SHS2 domain-containing protein